MSIESFLEGFLRAIRIKTTNGKPETSSSEEKEEDKKDEGGEDGTKGGSGASRIHRFTIDFSTEDELARQAQARKIEEAERLEREKTLAKKLADAEAERRKSAFKRYESIRSASNLEPKMTVTNKGLEKFEQAKEIEFHPAEKRIMEFVLDSNGEGRIHAVLSNVFCDSSLYGNQPSKAMDYFSNPNFNIEELKITDSLGETIEPDRRDKVKMNDLFRSHFKDFISSGLAYNPPKELVGFEGLNISDFTKRMKLFKEIEIEVTNGGIHAIFKPHGLVEISAIIDADTHQLEQGMAAALYDCGRIREGVPLDDVEDTISRKLSEAGFHPKISWNDALIKLNNVNEKIKRNVCLLKGKGGNINSRARIAVSEQKGTEPFVSIDSDDHLTIKSVCTLFDEIMTNEETTRKFTESFDAENDREIRRKLAKTPSIGHRI
jgi:hypothetical protein